MYKCLYIMYIIDLIINCVLCGIWDQSMHIMHTGTSIIYCINCVMELPN